AHDPGARPAEGPAAHPGGRTPGREVQRADPGRSPRPGQEDAAAVDLLDYLGAATLAAAGLLALLGRRRREQLWRRAFGRRIVRPRGDAADAEVAIRLGADAPGSRMLDLGLRLLGRLVAERGGRPPTLYAVHLSSRGLDLWIHPADQDAPEPWEAHDGGQVWRLPAHEGRRIDEHELAGAPAPYPGLVSLGTGEGGRVLVDLEAARGVVAMTGADTVAALSALAVELATNRWSDHMRITLVGFGEELALLAPERIRTAGSLAEALPEFEERARHDGDVLTGRVRGRVADPAYTPHYLLSAIRPDEEEARRLALLGKGGRTAAGFVVAGDLPHATWRWHIGEDGRARVDALGFDVRANLLPRRHYDAVVRLFRTAGETGGEPLTPPVERLSDEPPSIEVRILGPIEISPVNPLEEGRAALAHELVVYLATHPAGVHPAVLAGVLWPRGVQAAVRDATVARVAEWLGTDSEGRPHLFLDGSGRLRLGPEIRTDWRLFQELVRRAGEQADARRPGEVEGRLLEQALGLVRGPLLNGRPANRYAWLAADPLEYDVTAWVADAAQALCEIRLAHGDADAAVAAARAGLLLAADDEGLWRDLLRAAHATGDPARLRAVVDGLRRRAASHPYGGGMAPETEALIDELIPDWRRTAAQDLRTSRLA
ncbi:bacterial transcriptional activator domain-containing protein, partial [Microbispora sp. ATCC PTA-5024]|uniref:bacterial transcriptional activator domain-containing protein n=1 Tax=Microbispora sp. ATCC PTA-5024 TaxID=316330 RepID=UPI0003DCC3E3